MQIIPAIGFNEYRRQTTKELRDTFLLENLFASGEVRTAYWETDRTVVGAAIPAASPLKLETSPELASEHFCERREMGILNLGGSGAISVDGTLYSLAPLDALYVGRGSRDIVLASDNPETPANFYLISYPAHAVHPTVLVRHAEAKKILLGAPETANQRTIFQYIHEDAARSCQLVMGFTRLDSGSVWNTMPAHTHLRRSEVYLYFNLPEDAAVFHFMGPAEETRHLLMHDRQVALSPSWSIHSGSGTKAYSFVWAMGGENQRFADMDSVAIRDLR